MIEKRLEKFLSKFESLGIDGAFVFKDENRNYLSGFTGDDSFLFITNEKSYFITDSRYTEQAQNEVVGFEVVEYKPPIHDFVASLVEKHNVKRLGVEEDRLSFSDYIVYKEKLNGVELVQLEQTIEKIRMIKDAEEIKLIETAASIADKAFEHILGFIKVGMTEIEVALELEFFMKKLGASALSFPTIVASGNRSSLPHGTASEKVINEGDFITLDFGCVYKGYCSDMTRTIVLGKANEKQKEIYNTVLEANEAALKAVKPGISCAALDKIARDIIVERGYGERFGHGLGHGVGREVHELPYVNARSKFDLEPGMVITDEPGIYIPGFGGVRIEELVLVTKDGYRVLSKSPKHLIEL
ncbi:MAG: aminopeptidase P family protein [Clostridiales bacterium]|nr:aminopeptidase P family protein [Clostridiales bacterium]